MYKQLTSVAVVVGVAGHHRTSVEIGRQDESLRLQPVHHCPDFFLTFLHGITLKYIREITIQVHAVLIIPGGEEELVNQWNYGL